MHRGKMEQVLLAYSLPKETIIMMLYESMKVKVCSPDGDTDLFDIVTGVLQGDTSSPVHNLPRLCTSDMVRFNERK